MENAVLLEMKGITKRFGKTNANDHICLRLHRGEIHALLGENGAGKSTLMNILAGIYRPDAGQILANGELVEIKSPKHAANIGIGMVHQHFQLISTLSVAENVYLSMGRTDFIINKAAMEKTIRNYSEKFGLPVDPAAKIWQLSVGEQQRVEIMKLLCRDCKILILDEPSAVLTPQEAREMFKTLRNMADDGKSIIVISHKMNEVMENADRITVLKGGKIADEMPAAEATVDRLTKAVVGLRTLGETVRRESEKDGKPLLSIENLCAGNDKGLIALHDLSVEFREGEIFAIAGVAGSGQRELAETLAGMRKVVSGKITLHGKEITKTNVRQRISLGISFIPEDRLQMGLVAQMDMRQNAVLKDFREPAYSRWGILKKAAIRTAAESYVRDYDIKNGGMELPVGLMSGGNQQKLLVAREIHGNPSLIIAAYPVRGLDIGATEEINRILLEQKKRGACILLISEELDEIFSMADRIGVLCGGKLMGVRENGRTDYEEIGRLMSGEAV